MFLVEEGSALPVLHNVLLVLGALIRRDLYRKVANPFHWDIQV